MRQTLMQGIVSGVLLLLQTLAVNSLEQFRVTDSLPRGTIQCEQVGAIPDDESETCATYYICAVNSDNVLLPLYAQCPGSSVFSRELRRCVDASTYTCEGAPARVPSAREVGFQCTEDGRFPNVASTDCKSYYLCTKNTDGTLIAALVTCPSSTIFSEEKKSCVSSPPNICPHEQITTTAEPQSSSTLGEPADTFECPNEGRFVNEQSPDCNTYYVCIVINDILMPQQAECATGYVFSASELRCVTQDLYTCPKFTVPTVTTPEDTETTELTSNISLTPPPTTPTTTTVTQTTTTEATTETPTSTSEVTETTEQTSNIPLTPPPTTPTTTTVTQTTTTEATTGTPTSTSEVTETTEQTSNIPLTPPLTTPTTTTVTQTTTTDATTETPTSTSEVTETTALTSNIPLTPPPTTPTTTTVTQTTITEATTETPTSTSEVTETTEQTSNIPLTPPPTTSPSAQTTTIDVTTTADETTTTAVTITEESETPPPIKLTTSTGPTPTTGITLDTTTNIGSETDSSTTPEVFECPGEGRYPDPSGSQNCESYILCIKNSMGTFTPIQFLCPPNTIFSPTEGSCVSALSYSCRYETSSIEPPTMEPPTATTIFVPTPTPFVCPSSGRYPNPASLYCKSYYLCLYDSQRNLYSIEFSCPGSAIFSLDEMKCVSSEEYQCVMGTATTAASTTPTTTTTASATTIDLAGTCTTSGRFPTNTPNDCSSYQFCAMLVTGDFVEIIIPCPGSTLFDEERLLCSDKYVCPRGTN